jgi:hypothetical protein
MTLRNPKRLVPRDLSHASITKARPADAAATNNIAGLEQDTCKCRVPRAKEALARLGSADFRPRLAGPEKSKIDIVSQERFDRSNSPRCISSSHAVGSFILPSGRNYWLDVQALWAVEGANDFRNLVLKGRF